MNKKYKKRIISAVIIIVMITAFLLFLDYQLTEAIEMIPTDFDIDNPDGEV